MDLKVGFTNQQKSNHHMLFLLKMSNIAPIPKEKQSSETCLDREETFEPVAKSAKTTDIGSTSGGIAKKGKGKGKGRGK